MVSIYALPAQDYKSLKVAKIFILDKKLAEVSGITFSGNRVYAINDSGNNSDIYLLDKNDFNTVSSARVNEAKNHDRKEICSYNDTISSIKVQVIK